MTNEADEVKKLPGAFNGLTVAAKKETIQTCVTMLQVQHQESVSFDYMRQVLLGLRKAPPGANVARIVSAYFRGFRGIEISPDDVLEANGGTIERSAAG